jgi:hypothetical protein
VALLVGTELWGFVMPRIEDVESMKVALLESQPYYAVPVRIVSFDEFPKTMLVPTFLFPTY